MATTPPVSADAAAWDKARAAFAKSIMVDTPLASLATDLDVPPWPINRADETPAAYKDIDAVMAAQRDLVDVVHTLKQVVCVKG